ncbi:methanogenesis marker protein Mmp4/MtxX [Methanobrevibacter sp. DSM 116169]|uniref:methanogenesis marker protein Mmp4/MtxX n=1 Tax=Methanobrevibacter sp. DSM 116169 TaxID=3242727 RepID=UPI0038FD270C
MITIAIGVGENKNILKAIDIFKKDNDCKIIAIHDENELINSIYDKNTDIVIRGSLNSYNILKTLKSKNPNISRATYIKSESNEFLLSPVGIDEGNSIGEKFEIVKNSIKFLNDLGKTPKIAILSNGRKDDYGRCKDIDKSLKESEELYNIINDNLKVDIKNYYILIEDAIKEKNNIIITPNGIIGNYLFRTLVLIDSWPSCGAITFGLDKIYIDTSRSQSVDGYLRSINLGHNILIDRLNKNK